MANCIGWRQWFRLRQWLWVYGDARGYDFTAVTLDTILAFPAGVIQSSGNADKVGFLDAGEAVGEITGPRSDGVEDYRILPVAIGFLVTAGRDAELSWDNGGLSHGCVVLKIKAAHRGKEERPFGFHFGYV